MSGGHRPGYAAKVMVEQITEEQVRFSVNDPDFLKYLRRNGDCYICFVTPTTENDGNTPASDDSVGEAGTESQPGS